MRFELIRIATSPNWYVQWAEGGRSRRVTTGTPNRAEAEGVLDAVRVNHATRPTHDARLSTILDWYYEDHAKPTSAKPSNADLGIRYLKAYFGDTLASEITLAMQHAFADTRRKAGAGEPSIRRDLEVLSAALNRAVKHEKIDRAPAILSIAPPAARERFLSHAEAARLLRAIRTGGSRSRHVLLFTMLALHTGARTGAILELTWDRVDLGAGLVYYAKPGVRRRNKKRGTAPLDPVLIVMLRATKRRANAKETDHVITWAGNPVGRVAKAFINYAKAAGFDDVTPHTLRHTFASWAAQGGVSMFDIGQVIGQSVQATTERYAKHSPDRLRHVTRAARRLR